MPAAPLRLDPTVELGGGLDAIRAELHVPASFPPAVAAEAREVARRGPRIAATADLRDAPFLTIDPPDSLDLDQAVALSRHGRSGYLVRYAIADVGAFVEPGGVIDAEARKRAVTVYLPDHNTALHPPVLSEGAVSLLPDDDRQALVWEITLDGDGQPTDVRVQRAAIRSRARFTYAEVQTALDSDTAEEPLVLLREVGRLREAAEVARGGVSLPLPEQRVVEIEGRYRLEYRAPVPVEGWNAQISLLTGMSAARLMVDAGVGILRTLPAPSPDTVDTLRRRAAALGVPWPDATPYPDLIRSLDPSEPTHAALLMQAVRLFRGAGYLAFDAGVGGSSPTGAHGSEATPAPGAGLHAAVAAPYAHVTAPLRRLVDRFANEVVLALCAGETPPDWARVALPGLPALMAAGSHREGSANAMAVDLVEAAVLAGRIGEVLVGVVTNVHKGGAQVQIRDPAVVTTVSDGGMGLGQEVRLRVTSADVTARKVALAVA